MKYKYLCLVLFLLAVSCRDGKDERVVLETLRALGVASDPVVAKPTSLVTLTFYAVVPLKQKIEFTTFEDDVSVLAPSIKTLNFIDGSDNYEEHGHFRLFSVNAQFLVPPNDILKLKGDGSLRMRYTVLLTSNGDEEKIVGDVVVRPDGAKELTWSAPSGKIRFPAEGDALALSDDVDIEAKISNPNNEDLKIGWYVSNGVIENRRARKTTWETEGAPEQTLILTVRGKQSRGFSLDVWDDKGK